jgi:hypothetical protein
MFELLDSHVLPVNRTIIDEFLGHSHFINLELILRNISSYYYSMGGREVGDQLTEYTEGESLRIEKNLEGLAYFIDDMKALKLVTGTFMSVSLYHSLTDVHTRAREN